MSEQSEETIPVRVRIGNNSMPEVTDEEANYFTGLIITLYRLLPEDELVYTRAMVAGYETVVIARVIDENTLVPLLASIGNEAIPMENPWNLEGGESGAEGGSSV